MTRKPFHILIQETKPGTSRQNQEPCYVSQPIRTEAKVPAKSTSPLEIKDNKYTPIGKAVMEYLHKHWTGTSSRIFTHLRRKGYTGDLRADLEHVLESGTAMGVIEKDGLSYVPGILEFVRSNRCLRRTRRSYCLLRKPCPSPKRRRCPAPCRCRRRRCCGCHRLRCLC